VGGFPHNRGGIPESRGPRLRRRGRVVYEDGEMHLVALVLAGDDAVAGPCRQGDGGECGEKKRKYEQAIAESVHGPPFFMICWWKK